MLSADQFIEKLESLLSIGDRQIRIRADSGQIFVNFINLPKGVGGAGGGAEGENNRAMWVMYGFHQDHSIPVEKVKLKEILSRFDQRLKGKTGKPEAVAQYLAAFINKLAAEVEPKYTHTKPPVTSNLQKAIQLVSADKPIKLVTPGRKFDPNDFERRYLENRGLTYKIDWTETSHEEYGHYEIEISGDTKQINKILKIVSDGGYKDKYGWVADKNLKGMHQVDEFEG